MERWINRVALVTGASGGVGAAICKELLKQGMTVVGCARSTARLEGAKSLGKLHPIKCDVTRESDILSMFNEIRRKFDRLDVCINNTSLPSASSLRRRMICDWGETIEVNTLGSCMCILKEARDLMKEANISDGQIIQMGCIYGHEVTYNHRGDILPNSGMDNLMELIIRGLIECFRQELESEASNIRVATIGSGRVETNLFMSAIHNLRHIVDRPSESDAHPFTEDKFPRSRFASFQDPPDTELNSLCKKMLALARPYRISEEFWKIEHVVDAVLCILKSPPYVSVEEIIVQHIESRE